MTKTSVRRPVHPDHGAGVACSQMGIPIHQCDMTSAIDRIHEFIVSGRDSGRSHQVVTVNADFLVTAHHHEDVHAILREADLALADGMPIVWASALLGQRLEARIAGADLVPLLAERAAQRGHRIMFFGGSGDVADRAAELLRAAHEKLIIHAATGEVGTNGETSPAVLEEIRRFKPDVICVALGVAMMHIGTTAGFDHLKPWIQAVLLLTVGLTPAVVCAYVFRFTDGLELPAAADRPQPPDR